MRPQNRWKRIFLLLLVPFAIAACSLFHSRATLLPEHPKPLGSGRPQCFSCHDKTDTSFPYTKFNHDILFVDNHRAQALTGRSTCYLCHGDGFCGDCHDGRQGLKLSQRRPGDIRQRMPHRGRYLDRHQIEGRVNPVSCYRCHGNPERAERCVTCHGE